MKRILFAIVALSVIGCGDQSVVTPVRQDALLTSDLTFLHFNANAFANAEKSTSFWAVKGRETQAVLRYTDSGAEYLRFTVPAGALSRRPDGSAIEAGDSVLISIDADPSGRMSFSFSPSGLKFSGSTPARLRLDYARANRDLNGNGHLDLLDVLLELRIAVWRQEFELLPWLRIPTLHLLGTTVQADIDGFTDFGMAVN